MNFRSFNDLNSTIRANLSILHQINPDLIVGVPRSGMIPAYMIGLYLNLKVTDLAGFIENRALSSGATRQSNSNFQNPWEASRVLVVEDSVASGRSFRKIMDDIPPDQRGKITTLAAYASVTGRKHVDYSFELVACPRIFEWNVLQTKLNQKSGVDIDGVLCVDPTEAENDDGEVYRQFLLNAKPLFLPKHKIHSLVTSRLEKYRPETESWLKKHNIEYENLIMLDLPSKKERLRLGAHASHKASAYKNDDLLLFIESNPAQAREIMQITGKPVYSVESGEIISASLTRAARKTPKAFLKSSFNSIRLRTPNTIKDLARPIWRGVRKFARNY